MEKHEYVCQSCFHKKICPEYHPQTYSCVHHVDEADVATRAEVELWKGRTEAVFAAIPETRREFARKIFEEIDKLHIHVSSPYDANRYAELKNKYTGESQ